MTLRKKVIGLILVSAISIGVVGCGNNSNSSSNQGQSVSTDEAFIKDFEKAINKRWDEQDKIADKFLKDKKYTSKQYSEDTLNVLESEVATLEKNVDGIQDKDLKIVAQNYIEGAKKQIEAEKTSDFEIQSKNMEESEKLRKPALIAMVDEYGVVIKDAHQQTYKDFKEKATVIVKDNEAQTFADKLASEMTLEKTTDEYGYVEFTTIVENTSQVDFESLNFKVQYKDADDVVIDDDYIYLEDFAPGSKQKVKLSPYEDGVESLVIKTDWFSIK